MKVFIIGITGGIGGLLATTLLARGDSVSGLVRRIEQSAALEELGVSTHVGDIAALGPASLASMVCEHDVVVFAAGSNGGPAGMTDAVDGIGLSTALGAAEDAEVRRFLSVSVMPEARRRAHEPQPTRLGHRSAVPSPRRAGNGGGVARRRRASPRNRSR